MVQGVGFRYHTQHQAHLYQVNGYAKNCDDGSVEIVACGAVADVEQLIAWIRAGGPRSASVERVLTEPHSKTDYTQFSIRY